MWRPRMNKYVRSAFYEAGHQNRQAMADEHFMQLP